MHRGNILPILNNNLKVSVYIVTKFKFFNLFLQLMSFGQKVLGKTLFEFVLRKTMYSQFVAGETLPAIQDTIKMLRDGGIGTMLFVTNEEDLSTGYDDFRDRWG